MLRATAREIGKLAVVHLDAHTDCNPPGSGVNTGSAAFWTAHAEGLVATDASVHVGLRGPGLNADSVGTCRDLGYHAITMDEIVDAGIAAAIGWVRKIIGERPVYLCWDLDAFDPSVAPAVFSPSWGGIDAAAPCVLSAGSPDCGSSPPTSTTSTHHAIATGAPHHSPLSSRSRCCSCFPDPEAERSSGQTLGGPVSQPALAESSPVAGLDTCRSYGCVATIELSGVMRRFQSILMPFPEAEAVVEPFRRDGDWSSAHGIPSHVTIAGPWPLSVELPIGALAGLGAAIEGTRLELPSVGVLGDAVCLFPEDDGELLRWRASILGAVGAPDTVDSNWRPHLTVCREADRGTVAAVEAAAAEALPIACEARGLLLTRMLDESEVRNPIP